MTFTVVDLIRQAGYEPEPELSWRCGNAVRDAWVQEYGQLPDKQLRPKTNAQGTHCHAIYPSHFRLIAEDIVRYICEEEQALRTRQGNLFTGFED